MSNINRGAVPIALGIAKSIAIKDACDHFGTLFGANLNRKDTMEFTPDDTLNTHEVKHAQLVELFESKKSTLEPGMIENCNRIINNKETASYTKLLNILKQL